MRVRATRNNRRGLKASTKGYSDKHNDRNCPPQDHVDPSLTKYNVYYMCEHGDMTKGKWFHHGDPERPTIEEHRSAVYDIVVRPGYQMQQDKYKKKGQYRYMKSLEEWRKDKKHCPEETYLQVGAVRDNIPFDPRSKADRQRYFNMFRDYLKELRAWSSQHGGCVQILDASIQFDEAMPQMHVDVLWFYVEDGVLKIGQSKALEQAGVPLPDPSKPRDETNNRKQVFDAEMRERWLDVVERHGFDVIREPDRSRTAPHDLDKAQTIQMLINEEERRRDELKKEVTALTDVELRKTAHLGRLDRQIESVSAEITLINEQKSNAEEECQRLRRSVKDAEEKAQQAQEQASRAERQARQAEERARQAEEQERQAQERITQLERQKRRLEKEARDLGMLVNQGTQIQQVSGMASYTGRDEQGIPTVKR